MGVPIPALAVASQSRTMVDSNVGWRSMVIYGDVAKDGRTGDRPLDGDGAETLVPGGVDTRGTGAGGDRAASICGGTGAGGDRAAAASSVRAIVTDRRRRRHQFVTSFC